MALRCVVALFCAGVFVGSANRDEEREGHERRKIRAPQGMVHIGHADARQDQLEDEFTEQLHELNEERQELNELTGELQEREGNKDPPPQAAVALEIDQKAHNQTYYDYPYTKADLDICPCCNVKPNHKVEDWASECKRYSASHLWIGVDGALCCHRAIQQCERTHRKQMQSYHMCHITRQQLYEETVERKGRKDPRS